MGVGEVGLEQQVNLSRSTRLNSKDLLKVWSSWRVAHELT